jgi:hypothetical protein
VLGQNIWQVPISTGSGQEIFNRGNLSAGMYYCEWIVDGKIKEAQKIVLTSP